MTHDVSLTNERGVLPEARACDLGAFDRRVAYDLGEGGLLTGWISKCGHLTLVFNGRLYTIRATGSLPLIWKQPVRLIHQLASTTSNYRSLRLRAPVLCYWSRTKHSPSSSAHRSITVNLRRKKFTVYCLLFEHRQINRCSVARLTNTPNISNSSSWEFFCDHIRTAGSD